MELNSLRELKIELTQQCPLACVHCSTNSSRKQQSSLSRELVLRLLNEASLLGVEKVVFTGGEPLVAPYLKDAISVAASLGILPTLYTSGILDNALTPLSSCMATDLKRAGLSRFIFSLYSDRAFMHDSVTRYGTHKATLAALNNACSTGAAVEIHFVAMKRNFRDLAGIVHLAADLGVGKVSVLRFVPQGRGRNIARTDDLNSRELQELAESILLLRTEHPTVTIRAGSPWNILAIGHTPCNAAQDVLVINHRGDIFPCDAFKNVRYADSQYGSVLNASLREVWERSLFLRRVRTILSAEKNVDCQSCVVADACGSGCLAQKVVRFGWSEAVEADPGCLQTQYTHQQKSSELVQITVA